MVDEFQAFLLLALTGLFVYILVRVARDDQERVRLSRRPSAAENRSRLGSWSERRLPARQGRLFRAQPHPRA
jgi:hypothetical protein